MTTPTTNRHTLIQRNGNLFTPRPTPLKDSRTPFPEDPTPSRRCANPRKRPLEEKDDADVFRSRTRVVVEDGAKKKGMVERWLKDGLHCTRVEDDDAREYRRRVKREDNEVAASPSPKAAADLLRLRLRIALYKVRTNQTSTPISKLLLPGEHWKAGEEDDDDDDDDDDDASLPAPPSSPPRTDTIDEHLPGVYDPLTPRKSSPPLPEWVRKRSPSRGYGRRGRGW